MSARFLKIALPVPLRQLYDYKIDQHLKHAKFSPGMRVGVPFGREKNQIGVIFRVSKQSQVAPDKLRSINHIIDNEPLLSRKDLRLLAWASDYYHHPIGEVIFTALPGLLRRGGAAKKSDMEVFALSEKGRRLDGEALNKAPLQKALLSLLLACADTGLRRAELKAKHKNYSRALGALLEKGLIIRKQGTPADGGGLSHEGRSIALNAQQQAAVRAVLSNPDIHHTHVLQGITGSGKTEVYIEAIRHSIKKNRQALVLVPEIGLTTQFIDRLKQRLAVDVRVQHSRLNDAERLENWMAARDGRAAVIIGTRSAIWIPLKHPGIYIVDEEHDPSYKQEDGFRYSAKDIAVVRSHIDGVPCVLGSATPSLETIENIRSNKYTGLSLPVRALGVRPPAIQIVSLQHQALGNAFSKQLLAEIRATLKRKNQVLLFLNRRGYAPVILCHGCGWYSECSRCSSKMTYHKDADKLICHHCDRQEALPLQCPVCDLPRLIQLGHGTQRIDRSLSALFPEARILRMDRDSTRGKGAIDNMLKAMTCGDADILIGTQMLAKGHHFPKLTLVGIIDADSGLLSTDFRASERMAQLIVQVSGRAGRGDAPGKVMIQTRFPKHPLLQTLVRQGYDKFANSLLTERKQAQLPPYSYLALLRTQAHERKDAIGFLQRAREKLETLSSSMAIFGPVTAPIEKRRGRYRNQLFIQSNNRNTLRAVMATWTRLLESMPGSKKIRWSLDIDPQDML